MRSTKILATLGPATDESGALESMIAAGVDAVRLNFSHGSHDEHLRRCLRARDAARREGRPVAVLADLQGPKIRLGRLQGGAADLREGSEVALTPAAETGSPPRLPVDWPELAAHVGPGDRILLADGRVRLEVVDVHGDEVRARVRVGGEVRDRASVNLPGADLALSPLTRRDLDDLRFAVETLQADYVALSFVRRGADVADLKARLAAMGRPVGVVAKIERPEAVEHIEEILAALELGDGLMVARGDLGVECEVHRVPAIQKTLLRRADAAGVVCITATQMLESMMTVPMPSRAEASDVFNAILDGTDAVMLSGETAAGRYPVAAVETMAAVIAEAEAWMAKGPERRARADFHDETFELAICRAASRAAADARARAVVALTRSGRTALLLSKVAPPEQPPIFALTAEPATWTRMALYFGVHPVLLGEHPAAPAALWDAADAALTATGALQPDDTVVLVSGFRLARGATNVCKIVRLGRHELY